MFNIERITQDIEKFNEIRDIINKTNMSVYTAILPFEGKKIIKKDKTFIKKFRQTVIPITENLHKKNISPLIRPFLHSLWLDYKIYYSVSKYPLNQITEVRTCIGEIHDQKLTKVTLPEPYEAINLQKILNTYKELEQKAKEIRKLTKTIINQPIPLPYPYIRISY